jgi:hypothetical protein
VTRPVGGRARAAGRIRAPWRRDGGRAPLRAATPPAVIRRGGRAAAGRDSDGRRRMLPPPVGFAAAPPRLLHLGAPCPFRPNRSKPAREARRGAGGEAEQREGGPSARVRRRQGVAGPGLEKMETLAAISSRRWRSRMAIHWRDARHDTGLSRSDSHQATEPGEPGLTRSQPDCGRRRAVLRSRESPGRESRRNGDSEPAGRPARGGRNSSPATQSRAAASQPRSTRPRAQAGRAPHRRNSDSEDTDCSVGEGSDPPTAAQLALGLASPHGPVARRLGTHNGNSQVTPRTG